MQPVRRDFSPDGEPQVDRSSYIVVTGLPASGKTTLGRQLASRLGVDFFDKDDYLEALFGSQAATEENRQMLSRQSDADFIADAREPRCRVGLSLAAARSGYTFRYAPGLDRHFGNLRYPGLLYVSA
jgi:hypothetical protein